MTPSDQFVHYPKLFFSPYRDAQAAAKQKRLRVWRDWVDTAPVISAKDKEFTGKVVEIVNGDAIMVKKNKTEVRIHFISARGHPKTTLTKFLPFWTTYLSLVDICEGIS